MSEWDRLGSTDPLLIGIIDIPATEGPRGVRFMAAFKSDRIRPFTSVIVEGWDHVVNPRERSGSKYRKWCAEFSQQERDALSKWHSKMWAWEMRSGHPLEIVMSPNSYSLLERAANFFASV